MRKKSTKLYCLFVIYKEKKCILSAFFHDKKGCGSKKSGKLLHTDKRIENHEHPSKGIVG
jgi:hypothetical protein